MIADCHFDLYIGVCVDMYWYTWTLLTTSAVFTLPMIHIEFKSWFFGFIYTPVSYRFTLTCQNKLQLLPTQKHIHISPLYIHQYLGPF